MTHRMGRRSEGARITTGLWIGQAVLVGLSCAMSVHITSPTVCATDAPNSGADDQSQDAVPAPTSAAPTGSTDPSELLEQTFELMHDAQGRLSANQLDDETTRLQRLAGEHLTRLLKLMEQQAMQHPQLTPEQPPPDSAAPGSAAAGGTGDQAHQSPQAGESSEQPRSGDEMTLDEVRRRKNLATAVWGHLPPRLRGQMHGAFSERFLPQYDELVRRYYEALATQGDEEP